MAPSMNKFGVVLLVLIASMVFSADKAQAHFFECMRRCTASYVLCWHYCMAETFGYAKLSPQEINVLSEEAKALKHYAEPPSVQAGEKHP
ncbi:hypothetical protein C5167_044424 [Papaver somniferum]|uniref:Uncharacterized protein n=2 Tax=Papaver somniferum TaxID=3469 RepID=A0A4Y7L8P8_PAPSO|nr:hypothetical protein C5167_044422 [Papaver somniferum]RZC81873.1 hypothetical protein C5167_044424 [Papaver somniferum]